MVREDTIRAIKEGNDPVIQVWFLKLYCQHHSKPEMDIELFLLRVREIGLVPSLFGEAVRNMIKHFDIILVLKDNKVIYCY